MGIVDGLSRLFSDDKKSKGSTKFGTVLHEIQTEIAIGTVRRVETRSKTKANNDVPSERLEPRTVEKSDSKVQNSEKRELIEPSPIFTEKIDSFVDKFLTVKSLHDFHGHMSAERLFAYYPDVASLEVWKLVVKKCPSCLKNLRVKNFNQIDSTIPVENLRNGTWHLDYVFPTVQGRQRKIISLLDQATRYVMLTEVSNRNASQLEKVLKNTFAFVGSPNKIVSDREKAVLSGECAQFLAQHSCISDPLPRKTAWCNLVEKVHDHIKVFFAKNPKASIRDCQISINKAPFTNLSFTTSPYELWSRNNDHIIKKFQNELFERSKARQAKQLELRGKRIKNFERNFQVGDFVKTNKLNSKLIEFGTIISKKGSKFLTIKELDKNRIIEAHASHVKKIPFDLALFKKILDAR